MEGRGREKEKEEEKTRRRRSMTPFDCSFEITPLFLPPTHISHILTPTYPMRRTGVCATSRVLTYPTPLNSAHKFVGSRQSDRYKSETFSIRCNVRGITVEQRQGMADEEEGEIDVRGFRIDRWDADDDMLEQLQSRCDDVSSHADGLPLCVRISDVAMRTYTLVTNANACDN